MCKLCLQAWLLCPAYLQLLLQACITLAHAQQLSVMGGCLFESASHRAGNKSSEGGRYLPK